MGEAFKYVSHFVFLTASRAVCYQNALCAFFSLYQARYSKMRKLAERIIRAEKRSQKIKKNNLKKKQFVYTKTADSVQGAL